jgi:hypothetical protein
MRAVRSRIAPARRYRSVALVVLASSVVACGGSDGSSSATRSTPVAGDGASPCAGLQVVDGASTFVVTDYATARKAGVLTPSLDIGRLVADEPNFADHHRTFDDVAAAVGGTPWLLQRSVQRLQPTPYGPSDAQCVVSSLGEPTVDVVRLADPGSAVATLDADVSVIGSVAVVSEAGTAPQLVDRAEASTAADAILTEFGAAGVTYGTVQTADGAPDAGTGLGARNTTGSDEAVVLVWVRPDLTAKALTALADESIAASGLSDEVDLQSASVTAHDHTAVIVLPTKDATAAMEAVRSDTLGFAGLE